MKPTIIYYEVLNYTVDNLKLLDNNFSLVRFKSYPPAQNMFHEKAEALLTPLGQYWGKDKIDLFPNLKVIGSNTTSDAHIDVEYAKSKGIKVVTLKGEPMLDSITATAELTWGLIIALTRNIIPASKSVLDGEWSRWPYGGKKMLSDMTLGVIGYGRLGKMVARYGRVFGMDVKFYDPYWEKISLPTEIVTVHVPYTKENDKMFNKDIFSRMKQGSYFINTSRGELVDEDALLEALRSGHLAGAALDVLELDLDPEFTPSASVLLAYARTHDNLIITPHIGGSTEDAWQMTQEFVIRKILEVLDE